MGDLYRISGERLRGLAEQTRRLCKRSGELTPGQMEAALSTIEPMERFIGVLKGGLVGGMVEERTVQALAVPVFFPGGYVKDVTTPEELSGPMCFYNDVLLPGIPTEMLEKYPYAFIRKHMTDEVYQLIMSQTGFYLDGTTVRDNDVVINPKFVFPLSHSGETVWRNDYNLQYASWSTDENRILHWSNHDIPLGSPDAQEIGFQGSEPVPAE